MPHSEWTPRCISVQSGLPLLPPTRHFEAPHNDGHERTLRIHLGLDSVDDQARPGKRVHGFAERFRIAVDAFQCPHRKAQREYEVIPRPRDRELRLCHIERRGEPCRQTRPHTGIR